MEASKTDPPMPDRLWRRGYRFAQSITADGSLDVVAQRIVDRAAAMFDAERVSIALFDPQHEALRLRAATSFHVATGGATVPKESILGRVYARRKAFTVNDARALPLTQSHRNRYRTSSFAVAPLLYQRQCLGVLSITDKRQPATFDDGERIAVSLFAAAAARTIATARAGYKVEGLERAASIDLLTGLANRAHLDDRLQQELARSQRENINCSVLVAAIDNIKAINDSAGRAAGDRALQEVAEAIHSAVRIFDICARYTGNAFAVAMPNTDRAGATAFAKRLRSRLAARAAQQTAGSPSLSISIGTAISTPLDEAHSLLARAGMSRSQARDHDERETTAPDPNGAARHQLSSAQRPYMLIADPDVGRRAAYSTVADRYRLRMLLADDATEALRIIEQFGRPAVLSVNMSAPEVRGVAVIESIPGGVPDITVAVDATTDLMKYVRVCRGGPQIKALRKPVSSQTLIEFLERSLQRQVQRALPAQPLVPSEPADGEFERFAAQVRQQIDAPGVAVYIRPADGGQLRRAVSWSSVATMARAHRYLPQVVTRVLITALPLAVGDVGGTRGDVARDHTLPFSFGIVAAPVKRAGEVVGVVCAFGDGPIETDDETLTKFETLAEFAN